jgi:hypothetical protein
VLGNHALHSRRGERPVESANEQGRSSLDAFSQTDKTTPSNPHRSTARHSLGAFEPL